MEGAATVSTQENFPIKWNTHLLLKCSEGLCKMYKGSENWLEQCRVELGVLYMIWASEELIWESAEYILVCQDLMEPKPVVE